MTERYSIVEDDLTGAEIAALLGYHLSEMRAWSPPESVHAMPIERLRAADVTFYSAWQGTRLVVRCFQYQGPWPLHGVRPCLFA